MPRERLPAYHSVDAIMLPSIIAFTVAHFLEAYSHVFLHQSILATGLPGLAVLCTALLSFCLVSITGMPSDLPVFYFSSSSALILAYCVHFEKRIKSRSSTSGSFSFIARSIAFFSRLSPVIAMNHMM